MLLSELLCAGRLGLRLLHETPGTLDRPVGRVITIDLLEPGRFLTGGELVLTGLVWRNSPHDSETFVASVAGNGATTILAGKALLGTVPDDLLQACRRHRVTLVEVPADVPFADVTEHVAAAEAAEGGDRLSASLVRQREMLSAIAAGRSLDELVVRVSAEIGRDCRVLSPTGRHVVPGRAELGEEAVDAVAHTFLTADLLPAVATTGGTHYSLFPVGSALGERLTGWLVVVDGDHTTWPREQIDAVHELGAIVALDRSRRDEGLRALRRSAADALALVDSGAPHAEVVARVRQAGLDPDRPVVAAVSELGDGMREGAAARAALTSLLEDIALAVGPPVVAEDRDGRLVALLPATDDIPERVRAAVGRLAAGIGRDGRLSVGMSGPAGPDALAGALEEARFALRVARESQARVSVVGSDEVTSHVLLLATVPDDVRRTYANRVLGAVLEHDRRTDGELVATLTAFLDCSGSWARTAEALHLHVNSVRYRIERVQKLTGRDLSRLEDRVDVFLALKSL